MSKPIIRPIQSADNKQVAAMIREVLIEFGVPKVGSAYEDASLDQMYEAYDIPKALYLVVEDKGRIIGGAGIAQLANYDTTVCELQKMYFLEETRGRGIGSLMMEKCILAAKEFGYKNCYLETMSYMKAAQKLYQRTGFKYLNDPLGDTGHFSCGVHMLLDL